ncbi:DNA circularization protein, partial [Vibrio scophthalmi]
MNMTTENNHDYRPASFRGVEFFVDGIEGTGGRRAVPHAYPKRETGWTEDNGAVLSQQKVTGFCLGDDYLVQLAAILEALNKPGPGEMVHPWWGRQRVQIGKVTHSLSTKNGGYATISFEVFEAGNPLFPSQVADTSEEVKSAASSAREATIEEFETQFETEELPSYAQESLLDTFNGYSDSLKEMVNQLPDLPDDIGNWIDAIDNFKNNVGLLMAYPGQLAMQVTDLIYDVHNLVTTPPAALDVYTSLKNRFDGMKAYVDFEDGNTVDKAVSRNKALTQQLFINSLATEQAQSLSDSLNAMTTTKNGDDSDFDSKRAT